VLARRLNGRAVFVNKAGVASCVFWALDVRDGASWPEVVSFCSGLRFSAAWEVRGGTVDIRERTVGGVCVLDLSGSLIAGEAIGLLKDKVNSLLYQGHKHIVVNLAAVAYMDSSGLGELVSAYTTVARQQGKLKLLHVTKRNQDLLSITKLVTVFDTFDAEDAAVRSFAGQ